MHTTRGRVLKHVNKISLNLWEYGGVFCVSLHGGGEGVEGGRLYILG